MIFASSVFLFGFLPAFLLVYALCPARYRTLIIVIASYIFYGWWRIDFLALLIAVTLWSYWLGRRIASAHSKQGAKHWLWLGLCLNLGTLAYFKYANFGIDNLNAALALFGAPELRHANILLPIGVSFFVFQAVSYLIDIWRGDAAPARSLIDLAAFKALFPQLIAGPVLRYKDLADQFASREHSMAKFAEGWQHFAIGLAMKVLLADPLAPLVDRSFGLVAPTLVDSWLGALAYSAQLFFDFAGYSTMAVGLGLMIGFRFIDNFNTPYAARSITDFWQRWHISLSTWLRDYLYIPLGGNRGGEWLTYRNLLLTMVIGGLWHGANWTFIIWGLWHGLWMVVERAIGRHSVLPSGVRTLGTFLIVMVGWVFFRSADVGSAFAMMAGLIGLNGWRPDPATAWNITTASLFWLIVAYGVILVGVARARGTTFLTNDWFATLRRQPIAAALTLALFVGATTRLAAASATPFLYFQF